MTWCRAAAGALRGWRRGVLIAALVVMTSLVTVAQAASANVTTMKFDSTRQGWRGDLPSLKPPGYQQFDTPVAGQVYGQPLVWGNTVVVATEGDVAYGIDRTTGAITWQQSLGTPEPATVVNCPDAVNPVYGSTSTPVIDPNTHIVYMVARTWDGFNPGSATYRAFAFDAVTGALQPGWPVTIGGHASNDPGSVFDPTVELQRTGLTLLGGRIFFGYGSFCDQGAYKGWISGVSTSTRAQSLWVDETGNNIQGGIWQSSGGFGSDGTSLYLSTGNGSLPSPGPGTSPQGALGESSLRLTPDANGNLQQTDRFTPFNGAMLNDQDLDMGAGGPTLLPDSFGVPGHPHLLVQPSKTSIYLLDRENLGGMAGPTGPDRVVSELPNEPAFSHAAVWPGDGGLFYLTSPLRAFRVGPTGTLSLAGTTDNFPPDRSGPPIITSNGTTSGSATLWQINQRQGQLQAYNPVPVNGKLQLLWSAPINSGSMATKFAVAAADGNNVFVGSDGHVLGFTAPKTPTPTPVATSPQFGVPNQTDVFSVAPDGAVQVRWVTGGGPWFGPLAISRPGLAPPGARLTASNQFGIPFQTDVFVVGTNGAVQVLWVQGGGAWNGPLDISPPNLAPPGAGLAASNQFGLPIQTDVFVVDGSGTADVMWVEGGGAWSGPLRISPTGLAPAGAGLAASNQYSLPNQTDLFVVGSSGATDVLWVVSAGAWSGPLGIGPPNLAPPGAQLAASNQFGLPSQTDVFVVGNSGATNVSWVVSAGAWAGPLGISPAGQTTPGATLAVSNQFGLPDQTDVFVVGTNGGGQVVWVDGAGAWNSPLAVSPPGLAPAGTGLAATNQFGLPNQTDVFVVDNTGAVDVVWVESAGGWSGPLFT